MSSASLVSKPIGEGVLPVSTWNPRANGGDDEFSYIDLSSVDQQAKSIASVTQVAASEAPSRARQIVCSGDIIVSTVRPNLNAVAMVPDELHEATASTGFCVLRPDNINLDGRYLFHWVRFRSFIREMERLATGANYPAVSDRIIKNSEIPTPSIVEQKRIAAILDKADTIRSKRRQAIQLADEFLRSVFLDMFGDPVTNPKGWNMVALGKVCGVGSSKRVFVDELTDSGVPFFRGTEVGQLGDYEDISPRLFISEEHYEKLKKDSGVPKVGDLLLPSICHDGRIWKVDHEQPFYFKDGRVLWIKVDHKNVDSDYLRNHLKTLFLANYSKIASGTTFAELKIVNLKNLKILVPPLVLQKKYSEITCKARQISDRHKRTLEQEVGFFHSLSQRAFRGDL